VAFGEGRHGGFAGQLTHEMKVGADGGHRAVPCPGSIRRRWPARGRSIRPRAAPDAGRPGVAAARAAAAAVAEPAVPSTQARIASMRARPARVDHAPRRDPSVAPTTRSVPGSRGRIRSASQPRRTGRR
jgi:hypothetical protein